MHVINISAENQVTHLFGLSIELAIGCAVTRAGKQVTFITDIDHLVLGSHPSSLKIIDDIEGLLSNKVLDVVADTVIINVSDCGTAYRVACLLREAMANINGRLILIKN